MWPRGSLSSCCALAVGVACLAYLVPRSLRSSRSPSRVPPGVATSAESCVASPVQIFVEADSGTHVLHVYLSDTVDGILDFVDVLVGAVPSGRCFMFEGKQFAGQTTIAECGVIGGSCVRVMGRLLGGSPFWLNGEPPAARLPVASPAARAAAPPRAAPAARAAALPGAASKVPLHPPRASPVWPPWIGKSRPLNAESQDLFIDPLRDLDGFDIKGALALLNLAGPFSMFALSSHDCKHAQGKDVAGYVQIFSAPFHVYVTEADADLFFPHLCAHFKLPYKRVFGPKINRVILLSQSMQKRMSVSDALRLLALCGCVNVRLAIYGQKSLDFDVLMDAKRLDSSCRIIADIGCHVRAVPLPDRPVFVFASCAVEPSFAFGADYPALEPPRLRATRFQLFGDQPLPFSRGAYYDPAFYNPGRAAPFESLLKFKCYQALWHWYADDRALWGNIPRDAGTYRLYLTQHVPRALDYLRCLLEDGVDAPPLRLEAVIECSDLVSATSCDLLFARHAETVARLVDTHLVLHCLSIEQVIHHAEAAAALPSIRRLLCFNNSTRPSQKHRIALCVLQEQLGVWSLEYSTTGLRRSSFAIELRAQVVLSSVIMVKARLHLASMPVPAPLIRPVRSLRRPAAAVSLRGAVPLPRHAASLQLPAADSPRHEAVLERDAVASQRPVASLDQAAAPLRPSVASLKRAAAAPPEGASARPAMRAFSFALSGAAPAAASPSAALQEAQYQQFVASFNAIAAHPRQPRGQPLPAFKASSSAEQNACYEQFLFSAAASANAPQLQPMHSARATAPLRAVAVVQPVKPARVVEANLLREIMDEVYVTPWGKCRVTAFPKPGPVGRKKKKKRQGGVAFAASDLHALSKLIYEKHGADFRSFLRLK